MDKISSLLSGVAPVFAEQVKARISENPLNFIVGAALTCSAIIFSAYYLSRSRYTNSQNIVNIDKTNNITSEDKNIVSTILVRELETANESEDTKNLSKQEINDLKIVEQFYHTSEALDTFNRPKSKGRGKKVNSIQ
jgi:hypothetical protein